MKFSFLPSLGALAGWSLSRHGQTSFQAPSHATSPGPGRIAFPAYVFSNQALIIGNGDPTGPSNIVSYFENPFETAIFSLDLTVPWSASAPAWHKIDRPAGFFDPYQGRSPSGQLVMNKDGSIVYFFQDMGVQPYYVHRGEWGPVANLTSEYGIHHSLMVDSDLGHIYGISSDAEDCFCGMCYLDNEWSLRMFDPVANAISIFPRFQVRLIPSMAVAFTAMLARVSFSCLPREPPPSTSTILRTRPGHLCAPPEMCLPEEWALHVTHQSTMASKSCLWVELVAASWSPMSMTSMTWHLLPLKNGHMSVRLGHLPTKIGHLVRSQLPVPILGTMAIEVVITRISLLLRPLPIPNTTTTTAVTQHRILLLIFLLPRISSLKMNILRSLVPWTKTTKC